MHTHKDDKRCDEALLVLLHLLQRYVALTTVGLNVKTEYVRIKLLALHFRVVALLLASLNSKQGVKLKLTLGSHPFETNKQTQFCIPQSSNKFSKSNTRHATHTKKRRISCFFFVFCCMLAASMLQKQSYALQPFGDR